MRWSEADNQFVTQDGLTEAANRGIPLPEAMQQSLHKSVTQAASYYNNAERKNGRAARLIV